MNTNSCYSELFFLISNVALLGRKLHNVKSKLKKKIALDDQTWRPVEVPR